MDCKEGRWPNSHCDGGSNEWLEPVSDEDYGKLK